MQRIILPHIALFFANTIYAINYLFAKDVMPDYITPTGFILLRVFGASLIFFTIHSFFIKEKIKKTDLLYIILCAIFGVVINMLCFFEGLNITTPINASLIMITTPLIVYLISCVLEKKERTVKRFIGVLCGLFGAGNSSLNTVLMPNFGIDLGSYIEYGSIFLDSTVLDENGLKVSGWEFSHDTYNQIQS